jgi:hypothetical protein
MWWSLLARAVRPDVAKTIPVTQLCESNDAKLLDARQRTNSQLARYRIRRFGVEIVDTRTAAACTPDILVASELLRILRSRNVYPDCLAVNWSSSRPYCAAIAANITRLQRRAAVYPQCGIN